MHPAHVPLEVEAQAVVVLVGDHGEGSGLLGDEELAALQTVDRPGKVLEEGDGGEILPAAFAVAEPVAALPAEVHIEHAAHRVHPKAVHVALFQPVHGAGREEAADLGLAVIEEQCAPLLHVAPAGIAVFIAAGAVEEPETVVVPGEVGGDPVHDDAHAQGMGLVHEVLEIVRGPVAAGGGEVARHLIAPAGIVGVGHQGHDLDVGVAHVLDVGQQLVRQLPIGEALLPAAQVAFVDVHGALVGVLEI